MNKRDCEKLVKAAWRGVGVLTREAHMLRVLDALVSRLPDEEAAPGLPCKECGGTGRVLVFANANLPGAVGNVEECGTCKTSPEAGSDGQRSRPSQSSGDVLRAVATFRAWLMGEVTVEGGAFRSRRDGEGPYYWRTEARDRLAAIEAMLAVPRKPRISREVLGKCANAAFRHHPYSHPLKAADIARAVLEAAGMEVES